MYALGSLRHPQHCNQNFVYNFTFIHVFVGFQVGRFSQSNWAVPSVQYSHSVVSDFWDPMFDYSMPGFPVHHQFPELTQTHVHWVGDAIQPSHPLVIPILFHLQSFPASRSFPMSQFFISGGQSTGVSASASVLLMNIQGWFPLGLTGLISLQSKGLSRVFSNTTVQRHQFFSAQPSLWSDSHICTGLLEKS